METSLLETSLLVFAKNECENENHVLWETLELEKNFTGDRWYAQAEDYQEWKEKRFACPISSKDKKTPLKPDYL